MTSIQEVVLQIKDKILKRNQATTSHLIPSKNLLTNLLHYQLG
ncbi:hypothetical protein [uncultured Granulicatella sp.]|nr:hypothetical protein [uncultured Granulicatella sp.]